LSCRIQAFHGDTAGQTTAPNSIAIRPDGTSLCQFVKRGRLQRQFADLTIADPINGILKTRHPLDVCLADAQICEP
jgi:hypothetical protein